MLDKKKLKELVRFVQNEENSKDFEAQALKKVQNDGQFIREVLKADSSEVTVTEIAHVMTFLDAIIAGGEINTEDITSFAKSLSKRNDCDDIGKKLAMIISKTGFLYHHRLKDVFDYFMSIDLDEKTLSAMLRSKGFSSTSDVPSSLAAFFCGKAYSMAVCDLDTLIYRRIYYTGYNGLEQPMTIFENARQFKIEQEMKTQ